jgi:tRNA-dihydrouridine synthase B
MSRRGGQKIMLKIGSLKLKSNVIVAPLAGITDLPYRLLCRRFGAELAFSEMINVRSLGYNSRRTRHMLTFHPQDTPLGIQILGGEPQYVRRGLDILRSYKFELMNFNAACPERKVTRRGEGAALMKDRQKLKELMKLVVEESSVPATVKIRAGWDLKSVNARDVALDAEDAGMTAVFIHGRTRMHRYTEKADYKVIAEVKKAVRIPVIGSGDVFCAESAARMLEETGCDGVLVARGGLGNPWIFREIAACLGKKPKPVRPGVEEIIEVMIGHLNSSIDFYGQHVGVTLFHKFFAWYTKGLPKVRPLRELAYRAKTVQDMQHAIYACRQS